MDSAVVRDRLQFLSDQHNGRLTPEIVLQDALDQHSPLHSQAGFEWDTQKAARLQWLHHARFLIRSVRVILHTETIQIKSIGYVRDPQVQPNQQGYVSVATLKTDRQLALEALQNEVERALSHLQRAKNLSVGLDLEDEFEQMYNDLASTKNLVVQAIQVGPVAEGPAVQ